jgi:hypothetical protein
MEASNSLLGFLTLSRAWFGIVLVPLSRCISIILYAYYNHYDNISIHLVHVLGFNVHRLL